MRRLIKIFVKTELFKGQTILDESNKRFFPRKKTIKNHMIHSRRKLCYSLIDQECLQKKIEEWKSSSPEISVFFRPKSTIHNNDVASFSDSDDEDEEEDEVRLKDKNIQQSDKLLFVYQSAWQKRLYQRYGNEMLFLDATYRTTRYTLPLFFLVVKTNIDYQIVGTFVTENETMSSVQEALSIFKKWNPNVSPRYGMTDYCMEEINAMETTFPGMFLM